MIDLLPVKTIAVLFALLLSSTWLFAQKPARPFPQHAVYNAGSIIPNHLSRQKLDLAVIDFYRQWKSRYVRPSVNKNQRYIWFERPGKKQCVSEGQGYGMIITVLMAGADPEAKTTFDALFSYYKAHPAKAGQHLMSWAQDKHGKNLDRSSATDGDLDIAYSLLLADQQWSSGGAVNYLKEAKALLADIMKYEINPKSFSILLGNDIEYDSKDYFDTRSSDFMPSHFKAFETATGDRRWRRAADATYALFKTMQQTYSPDAGLVPDFIQHVNKRPRPAVPNYLESKYDGCYNYNACRVPWRVAADYLLYGDKRAKALVTTINRWIRNTTENTPYNLSAGYSLAGNDLPGRYFEALSFIAPFAVSAMTDAQNQHWLNDLWDYLNNFKLKDYDYYDNSIKMLNLIILSGNYWKV
ncbi:MAG TPA: glycosyl hydrolase family 8 [Mucilaginibacter sp.]